MTLALAHTNGDVLPLKPGLPASYNGAVMHGANASHVRASFGQVVVQEYNTDLVNIRKLSVIWKKPERLVCRYNYPPGIFSRVLLNTNLHEYLKGAGGVYLKREEFSLLAGSRWMGLLIGERPGEYHCVDMHWSAALAHAVSSDPVMAGLLNSICDGVCDRIMGAAPAVNTEMAGLLASLQRLNFGIVKAGKLLHRDMKRYLALLLREIKEQLSLKAKMKESEWNTLVEAKQLIASSDRHYTTPELSVTIGMNEQKLKKLFPMVTGFKVDEYRKYLLHMKTAKKIMQMPEEPMKTFFEEAGYTSLTTFIRGFRRICYCTPGELRSDAWDLSGMPQNIEE
jgi:AraC-like DNA-binding protein